MAPFPLFLFLNSHALQVLMVLSHMRSFWKSKKQSNLTANRWSKTIPKNLRYFTLICKAKVFANLIQVCMTCSYKFQLRCNQGISFHTTAGSLVAPKKIFLQNYFYSIRVLSRLIILRKSLLFTIFIEKFDN